MPIPIFQCKLNLPVSNHITMRCSVISKDSKTTHVSLKAAQNCIMPVKPRDYRPITNYQYNCIINS